MKVLPVSRYILATQLEPTHAREVFPCFDEPQMKAVFNVTIIHRRHTDALGNADKSGKENRKKNRGHRSKDVVTDAYCMCFVLTLLGTSIIDDEWEVTTFYPTPKMSTYLFAFTVSEFKATPSQHERVIINVRIFPL